MDIHIVAKEWSFRTWNIRMFLYLSWIFYAIFCAKGLFSNNSFQVNIYSNFQNYLLCSTLSREAIPVNRILCLASQKSVVKQLQRKWLRVEWCKWECTVLRNCSRIRCRTCTNNAQILITPQFNSFNYWLHSIHSIIHSIHFIQFIQLFIGLCSSYYHAYISINVLMNYSYLFELFHAFRIKFECLHSNRKTTGNLP